jgi:CRISPR-associated protein Csm2
MASSNRPSPPQNKPSPKVGANPRKDDIIGKIKSEISQCNSLKEYPIRKLVNHTSEFGYFLHNGGLKSSQLRKFLDGINRAKAELAQAEDRDFSSIKNTVILLQPKFAYAAAKQDGRSRNAAKALSEVTKAAIEIVHDADDFDQLVAMFESTVAYHKEAEVWSSRK